MDTMPYTPVTRQNRLSIQVSDQLEGLILSKELKPGDRLPTERELSQRFSVSRTVIREAIRILEARRFVTTQGGSGTFVKDLEAKDVVQSLGIYISIKGKSVSYVQLMELRRIMEVQIAALAAERASKQAIQELSCLVKEMETATKDPAAFAKGDLDFHVALARATGNELLVMLLDPLMDVLYEARRVASELPGVPEEALRLHRNILRKVRARDAEGAARAMSKHLDQSCRVTLEGLKHHPELEAR